MFLDNLFRAKTEKLSPKNKEPRLFALSETLGAHQLSGVKLWWPDRFVSGIQDMGFSGIMIPSTQVLNRVKVGQKVVLELRVDGLDLRWPKLELLVDQISAQSIKFLFAHTVSGRLQLAQDLKDQIIFYNLLSLPPEKLNRGDAPDYWLHGPFDTNFMVWKRGDWIAEYDGHWVSFLNQELKIKRSHGFGVKALGYTQAFDQDQPPLHPGENFVARLTRWLEEASLHHAELKLAVTTLKTRMEKNEG